MTAHERAMYRKCIEESHGMCFICGRPAVQIHHVYGGANRDNSTKYGLLVYLCADCHENAHRYRDVKDMLSRWAHDKFKAEYPDLDFYKTFRRQI